MASTASLSKLLPLANPKHVRFLCELCGGLAYLQCAVCKVTYYCNREHMKVDRSSIHARICHLLARLRNQDVDMPFMGAQSVAELRKNRTNQLLIELIEITEKVARRHILEDHPADAVPAALQHRRCTELLHGPNTVHLAVSYTLLAEASLGTKRLQKTFNYLAQAEWIIMQDPVCPHAITYRLYHAYGQVYAYKREFDEARRCFADNIYFATEAFGIDDIRAASGYFNLAKVFLELNRNEVADSLFDKVTDIWCGHLTKLVRSVICGPAKPKSKPYNREVPFVILEVKENRCLDEADAAEANRTLDLIYLLKNGPQMPDKVPKTSHCLAMYYFLREDFMKAEKFGHLALYETRDLPYRRDAEEFVVEYVAELKRQHGHLTENADKNDENDEALEVQQQTCSALQSST